MNLPKGRYVVQVAILSGDPFERDLALVVPYHKSGLVEAFTNTLLKRPESLQKLDNQSVRVSLSTHKCTLHLGSKIGPIFDGGDSVADAFRPEDKFTAVITRN